MAVSSVSSYVAGPSRAERAPKNDKPAFEPIRLGESEDSVMERFYPILKRIALKMAPLLVSDYGDCLSDGGIGVLKAIRTYDAARAAFHTHATNMAVWEMIRGCHQRDPISDHARKRLKSGRLLEESVGRMLSEDEIEALIPGYKADAEAAHLADNVRSWDALATTDNLAFLGTSGGQDDGIASREISDQLAALPEREREAITLRFIEDRPLKEVCALLGVKRSSCQRIIRLGLAKIKNALTTQALSTTRSGAPTSAPLSVRPTHRHFSLTKLSALPIPFPVARGAYSVVTAAAVGASVVLRGAKPKKPAPTVANTAPAAPAGRMLGWPEACHRVLLAGPAEGMGIDEIHAGTRALGVVAKGPKVSKKPLLMVADGLYRLRDKGLVERSADRFWSLTALGFAQVPGKLKQTPATGGRIEVSTPKRVAVTVKPEPVVLPAGRMLGWPEACHRILLAGPADGMGTDEILAAAEGIGVVAKGPKVSKKPLLMVDDGLYRLRGKGLAERSGRCFWRLTPLGFAQPPTGNGRTVPTVG